MILRGLSFLSIVMLFLCLMGFFLILNLKNGLVFVLFFNLMSESCFCFLFLGVFLIWIILGYRLFGVVLLLICRFLRLILVSIEFFFWRVFVLKILKCKFNRLVGLLWGLCCNVKLFVLREVLRVSLIVLCGMLILLVRVVFLF